MVRCRLWVTILIVMTALWGCSASTPQQTKPAVSPTTGQPLKGWQKPYEVYGVSYTPLLDHQGFSEEGIASWYGKKFHGRKTSNGEIYDMYAMTAAHKTLPLGVYVQVDNLNNGKTAVVRVNDRGPFVTGRIIDLSYTAASRLGVVGPGTAPVRITALGYQEWDNSGKAHYTLPQSVQSGPFTVQVGAFTQQQNATRLAAKLERQYGRADVQEAWVDGRLFYRVRAGKYDSLESAQQGRHIMEQQGLGGGFVVAID
nr:septal ring lytic transglycosylase RlpA family protein [uncultured Desulfuromonas sp.]